MLTLFEGMVTVDLVRQETRLLTSTGLCFWTPKSLDETIRTLCDSCA